MTFSSPACREISAIRRSGRRAAAAVTPAPMAKGSTNISV